MLEKSVSLYDRDEKGQLIPQVVKLEVSELDAAEHPELVGLSIAVTPMTRGEIKRVFSGAVKEEADADGELILEHCKEPQYTKEEIPFIKPELSRSIVSTICRESGIKFKEGTKKLDKDSDEFGKNS